MGTYCTRSDVLAILSQDSEARLTTDAKRAVILPVQGDGLSTVFSTPFVGATTITATVAGVPTGLTLLPNAGPDGVDQIAFAVPPDVGAVIAVKGDTNAIDTSIVDRAIADACDEIDSYIPMNLTPIQVANVVRLIRPKAVFLVKWRLRRRRDQQEWDPIMKEYAQTYAWLMAFMQGKISLPIDAPLAQPNAPGVSYGGETGSTGEPALFDPPYSSGRIF
jgi:phage gp36-like protein